MPFAIDQDALDSPSLKVLDIQRPPVKMIPHAEFPKMIYLHPKDKTQQHRTRVVDGYPELEAAQKQGWRTAPHIPEAAPDIELEGFEYEAAPDLKRGPGRPKNDAA